MRSSPIAAVRPCAPEAGSRPRLGGDRRPRAVVSAAAGVAGGLLQRREPIPSGLTKARALTLRERLGQSGY
ncbi:MAG: hypothetical protein AW07_03024 [Candidatus Accumulibacter sp. SK-11]|nr:MAG: hypothetical protein AW07_03024 [Candidatus Accumulibacter sp. SK-11]